MMEFLKDILLEVETLEKLQDERPNDVALRRAVIRSAFAAVETLANVMLQAALPGLTARYAGEKGCSDSRHRGFFEICAASDQTYNIDADGKVALSWVKVPLRNKILFAIRCVANSQRVTLEPRQVDGWNEFLQAIQVRNRITHPKVPTDLIVSAADQKQVMLGLKWLIRCHHRAWGGTDI